MVAVKKKRQTSLMRPVKVSAELEAVIGKGPMPRTEVMKKAWDYIKKHKLQNPKNKREIIPDDKLGGVVGKKHINMFDMTKKIHQHLS